MDNLTVHKLIIHYLNKSVNYNLKLNLHYRALQPMAITYPYIEKPALSGALLCQTGYAKTSVLHCC